MTALVVASPAPVGLWLGSIAVSSHGWPEPKLERIIGWDEDGQPLVLQADGKLGYPVMKYAVRVFTEKNNDTGGVGQAFDYWSEEALTNCLGKMNGER